MRAQLLGPLTTDHFGPITTHLPLLDVRLLRPGTQVGPKLRTIVDTGASVTLAHTDTARLLGLTAADLAAGPSLRLAGVGGQGADAHGVRLDLVLGPTRSEGLALPGAWVFFAEVVLPLRLGLLLGQHDALARLTYVQRLWRGERRFVLRFPD